LNQYRTPPWCEQVPDGVAEVDTERSTHSAISFGTVGVRPTSHPQVPTVWGAQLPCGTGVVVRGGAVVDGTTGGFVEGCVGRVVAGWVGTGRLVVAGAVAERVVARDVVGTAAFVVARVWDVGTATARDVGKAAGFVVAGAGADGEADGDVVVPPCATVNCVTGGWWFDAAPRAQTYAIAVTVAAQRTGFAQSGRRQASTSATGIVTIGSIRTMISHVRCHQGIGALAGIARVLPLPCPSNAMIARPVAVSSCPKDHSYSLDDGMTKGSGIGRRSAAEAVSALDGTCRLTAGRPRLSPPW
jgi:hypothetical protein